MTRMNLLKVLLVADTPRNESNQLNMSPAFEEKDLQRYKCILAVKVKQMLMDKSKENT